MLSLFREQPRAFYTIFMLEIWERFGFYTVQGILTLYFIRFLGFDDQDAYYAFGAFSALVYGMVAVGGYLGDQILGTKRTLFIGLCTLAMGYLALAIADETQVFWALGLICVGNGLFKANPSSLLAKCYSANDARLQGAFTLYYMAVNLGSIFALFAGPYLAVKFGYPYAYFLSFIGLVLGLANYGFQKQILMEINTFADKDPLLIWQWGAVLAGIILATIASAYLLQYVVIAKIVLWVIIFFVLVIYFFYMSRESQSVVYRMMLALILMLEAVFFFVLYQQMPTSINLFAVNNVRPYLLGVAIDPQSFQALNPIWILLISPFLALGYKTLHQKGIYFATPHKFALGMSCCGLSFLLLFFARFAHNDMGMVSSGWLVGSYFLQSIGELLVSALGVAMVAELVPQHISGFVMGMFFLTPAVAAFLGAFVASFTALPQNLKPGLESLFIYTNVFASIGLCTLGVSAGLWLIAPFLTRLIGRESTDNH